MTQRRTGSIAIVALFAFALQQAIVGARAYFIDPSSRDFPAMLDSAARYWRTGLLYSGPGTNLNAPHATVLLFSPFVPFGAGAIWAWWTFSLVCIAVSLALLRRELGLSWRTTTWVAALAVASGPLQHQWIEGNAGGPLLLISTLAWRQVRHQERRAWWLVVAISFKPWIGLLLFLQRRGDAARTILAGIWGAMGGLFLCGLQNWAIWAAILVSTRNWPPNPWTVSAREALRWQFGDGPAVTWIGFSLCAVLVAASWWRRGADRDRQWLLFGIAGLLVSPISWTYYLVVVLPAAVAWGQRQAWPWPLLVAVGVLLVPVESFGFAIGPVYAVTLLCVWGYVLQREGAPSVRAVETIAVPA